MLKTKYSTAINECGTDEAGRGCLAGPVTAAAVILPQTFTHKGLTDSKKLTEKQRYALRPIIEKQALSFAVAHVFETEIDTINILNASVLAMHKAIEQLIIAPEFIIVDGNYFKPFKNIPHQTIIKGDSLYLSIAAASILAKTYRDDYMTVLHQEYPNYGWKKNKGYPTAFHRKAIQDNGITPYHRKSFRLLPEQLNLAL